MRKFILAFILLSILSVGCLAEIVGGGGGGGVTSENIWDNLPDQVLTENYGRPCTFNEVYIGDLEVSTLNVDTLDVENVTVNRATVNTLFADDIEANTASINTCSITIASINTGTIEIASINTGTFNSLVCDQITGSVRAYFEELTVNGTVSADRAAVDNLSVDGTAAIDLLQMGGTLQMVGHWIKYNDSAPGGININTEGKVVIGSGAYTASLNVGGDALVRDNLTVSENLIVSNNLSVWGITSFNGRVTANAGLHVTENLDVSGNLTVWGTSSRVSGDLRADYYYGDGSNLENVGAAAATALSFTGREENVSPIIKGQPVYITGATASLPQIGLANSCESAKADVVGLAAEAIAQNSNGLIRTDGIIETVDTRASATDINPWGQTWSAGDNLYLLCNSGGIINIVPTSGRIVHVAHSLKGSAVNDDLLVHNDPGHHILSAAYDEDVIIRMGGTTVNNPLSDILVQDASGNVVAQICTCGKITSNSSIEAVLGFSTTSTINGGILVITNTSNIAVSTANYAVTANRANALSNNNISQFANDSGYVTTTSATGISTTNADLRYILQDHTGSVSIDGRVYIPGVVSADFVEVGRITANDIVASDNLEVWGTASTNILTAITANITNLNAGSVTVANTVNATAFVGDGSLLTGLPVSGITTTNADARYVTPNYQGGVSVNGRITGNELVIWGTSTFNIAVISTASIDSLNGASATFSSTINANAFSGDGSLLTGLVVTHSVERQLMGEVFATPSTTMLADYGLTSIQWSGGAGTIVSFNAYLYADDNSGTNPTLNLILNTAVLYPLTTMAAGTWVSTGNYLPTPIKDGDLIEFGTGAEGVSNNASTVTGKVIITVEK